MHAHTHIDTDTRHTPCLLLATSQVAVSSLVAKLAGTTREPHTCSTDWTPAIYQNIAIMERSDQAGWVLPGIAE